MSSSIQQRREEILVKAYQRGYVEVSTLSAQLGVSEATIRRDLRTLAEEGKLQLSHGGASVLRGSDHSFLSRSVQHVEEKRLIGRLAAEMVADGDQIFLDSGTTCAEMTRYLRTKKRLSVIVNSVRSAQELFNPDINVVLVGGQYRPDRMDCIGPMAAASLQRLRGYRAFFGSDGLGMDFGPAAIDIESASLFGQAVQSAREAVLVVDHSKFAAPALYRIVAWSAVSTVVTDRTPPAGWQEFFASQQITVMCP